MVWSWFSNKSKRLYSCCRSWAPHRRTLLQTAWTWPPHCHPWPCSSMPQYVHIYLYYLYCLCIIYIYIYSLCVCLFGYFVQYMFHTKKWKKNIDHSDPTCLYILSSTCDTYYLYQVVPGHAGKKVAIRWLEEMDDLEKVQHCINEWMDGRAHG